MSDKIGFLLVGFLLVRFGGRLGDGTDIPSGIWVGRFLGAALAAVGYEVYSRTRVNRPRDSIAQGAPETLAVVVGTAGAGTGGGVLAIAAGMGILLSVAIAGVVGILAAVFIRAGR
ncbi:MAG: hypothetical protein QF786_12045 [Vicinamibacterales bacterium]|jgi:hypothetical protein|nr:hypothetical protein [Vicinamibacterales bacterium]HJN45061.1 hypothetical protein [Vicinamibacterales bacterium]